MKRLGALAATMGLLAACSSSANGSGTGTAAPSGALRIYAASSLTEAFNELKHNFAAVHPGATISITYGASSDLATQIAQGAPADVFASASKKNMASLGGTALHPVDFVSNVLTVVVPPANPARIASLPDVAKKSVKVAICAPAVPCGVVAAQVFAKAGITVKPTASEPDVKSVLAAVESGEVDAGLVYVTDARAGGAKVRSVSIPTEFRASTTYPIAALRSAKNAALAKAWVDYVLSAAARKVLGADGFGPP
ncbi:MAG: molybdate ABC transporter substrate-binding protein [Jatrophihabitans sp.]|uniref:molybdate ABC transporter substrate-binding protein n=1 Tax=Jatrophihabitans sp. TaxID=1932789 RepID=UPI0039117A88